MTGLSPLTFVVVSALAVLLFVGLDLHDHATRTSLLFDRVRVRRNLAYLVSNVVTMLVLSQVTRLVLPHVPALSQALLRALPTWLECVLCVLVAELLNWLAHFIKHKNATLWRFHVQHHVETQYSTALTLHTHGAEVVITGTLMALVLGVCGFSRFSVDVFTILYFVANLYKHCSAKLSLGPLDALIVSPAFHRVHHSQSIDGNYGSVLTVYDWLFRTAIPMPFAQAAAQKLGVRDEAPFGFVDEWMGVLGQRWFKPQPAPAPHTTSRP